jgi:histidinol-phosphate/aromatic aminotransferase/cobyric acid decarboxylase-like protein
MPAAANFFLLRAAMEPAELQEALLRAGVRVRSMAAYRALAGGPGPGGRFATGWVRVSVGTPTENSDFLAALDRILD